MHTAVSLGYYLKGAIDPVAYFPREIFSLRLVEGREFPALYLFSVYADQRQLFFPAGDNYFSPLPLVNGDRNGE